MKRFAKLLYAVLAVELCAGVITVAIWMSQPVPPRPDVSHLHSTTQNEIHDLRNAVLADGSFENWQQLGEAWLLFGRFSEAEHCFGQATELAPGSYRAQFWRALALNQLGDMEAAIRHFQKALALVDASDAEPQAASWCWYGIGRNRLRQERLERAEDAFRKAGDFVPARHQLIRILIRSESANDAIELLNPLIARYPEEREFYQLRAAAREQLADAEGAANDRRRVERCPERLSSDALVMKLQQEIQRYGLPKRMQQVRTQIEKGQPAEAVEQLRALPADEWRAEIARLSARAELQVGNAQQAADALEKLAERLGPTPEILEQLGYALKLLGKNAEAVAVWKRAARMGNLESVHRNLADHYQRIGDRQAADRHRALAAYARGMEFFRRNELSDARADFQIAVKYAPNFAHGSYYLAQCHLANGDAKRAGKALRNCLKADPHHGRALRELVRLPRD